MRTCLILTAGILGMLLQPVSGADADLPANTWVQFQKDAIGARRGCAIRVTAHPVWLRDAAAQADAA